MIRSATDTRWKSETRSSPATGRACPRPPVSVGFLTPREHAATTPLSRPTSRRLWPAIEDDLCRDPATPAWFAVVSTLRFLARVCQGGAPDRLGLDHPTAVVGTNRAEGLPGSWRRSHRRFGERCRRGRVSRRCSGSAGGLAGRTISASHNGAASSVPARLHHGDVGRNRGAHDLSCRSPARRGLGYRVVTSLGLVLLGPLALALVPRGSATARCWP